MATMSPPEQNKASTTELMHIHLLTHDLRSDMEPDSLGDPHHKKLRKFFKLQFDNKPEN